MPVNSPVKERKRGSPAPSTSVNQKVLVQDGEAARAEESLGSAEIGGSVQASV